jgi:hypothetical protein
VIDEQELARRNNRLGIILFLIAVGLVAATIVVAFIYNSAN